jgi:protoheme IX farnesyltransferase
MSSPALAAIRSAGADYVELTKPRISLLVVLTTLVGYVLASPASVALPGLAATLLGTGLVAAGASVLNMLLERDVDARMHRTRSRPLPAGRLRPAEALAFGSALSVAGLTLLLWHSGTLAAAVAALTWASYVLLYTPLKRATSLCTIVGAVPGALPPVIGWAASRGSLEPGAFLLFAILFLWQIPHFLAIAWIYREDYARGGLPVLPVLDPAGRLTGRQAVANSIGLTLVSLAPAAAGLAGQVYPLVALGLGLGLTAAATRAALRRTPAAARALFLTSLAYLPLLCAALLLDRP